MPYKNIVFVKLEKRLLDDHRWYMMSQEAQLIYIKLMLLAAATYNKIPKNTLALRMGLKAHQEGGKLEEVIKEIQRNFPKFKQTKDIYYFKDFHEKTNFVKPGNPGEIPGSSEGSCRVRVEEEKSKNRIDKEKNSEAPIWFETVWGLYPCKIGRNKAYSRFCVSVKTGEDLKLINQALENYNKSERVQKGYIQNGSTWFNNWRDWINPPEAQKGPKLTDSQRSNLEQIRKSNE